MYQKTEALERCEEDLRTFVRNRYFYGKLLDVHHFDAEQRYFNQKRWLLNRMISGAGVVCGLDVALTEGRDKLFVEPGFALDRAGHEVVVPSRSKLYPLPELPPPPSPAERGGSEAKEGKDRCDDDDSVFYHVCIAWQECLSDPELVRVGSACGEETATCSPGTIRERYEVLLREGRASKPEWWCDLPEAISSGRLNYDALARFVTKACPSIPKEPCIPLANLEFRPDGESWTVKVDITVRPIVYTNELLFELLLDALTPNRSKGGKY